MIHNIILTFIENEYNQYNSLKQFASDENITQHIKYECEMYNSYFVLYLPYSLILYGESRRINHNNILYESPKVSRSYCT